MFRNGLYKVFYRGRFDEDGFVEHALAVMRDGKIIGSDRHGGVFTGQAGSSPATESTVSVDFSVPPGGELVTGFSAGAAGATIKIKSQFDPGKLAQFATVDVGGERIELQIVYVGPIPE